MSQLITLPLAKAMAKRAILESYRDNRLIFKDGKVEYTDKKGTMQKYSYTQLARLFHVNLDVQWQTKTGGQHIEPNTGLTVADVEHEIKVVGGIK